MAEEATEQVRLRAILELIDRGVRVLADDESSIALACESQARAAQAALQQVVSPQTAPPDSQGSRPPGARLVDSVGDSQLLLVAAERQLAALPAQARNQLPVCAAATYLRRARRALATP